MSGAAGRAVETTARESTYAKHEKVYSRAVDGHYARLRRLAVFTLLGVYYALPWAQWDGRQAVLFDLPERKFYVFGLVLWPQDFIYLAWLLVLAAVSLAFFTALAGRLWCGYACPQTVWTETFLWIERLVEGDRSRQVKLAKSRWTREKLLKKATKQAIWIAFAAFTGATFVAYFVPAPEIFRGLATQSLDSGPLLWCAFYAGATYVNAGYMREQVCKYMCPYARFQSAMVDSDTLVISYDGVRGEPRGARGRHDDATARGLGSCVDCTTCVQVCPTGIDIRDGLQNECIACAACIDACDAVMDKVGQPRGLIRYVTQNALEGRPSRILRPRVYAQAAFLAAIFAIGVTGLLLRTPLDLNVMRDRNALYRQTDEGTENVYELRVLNKDARDHVLVLSVRGLDGARLGDGIHEWTVPAGEAYSVPVRVEAPETVRGGHDLWFDLRDKDDPQLATESKARFIAP